MNNKSKAIILIVITFILGISVGFLIGRAPRPVEDIGPMHGMKAPYTEMICQRLNLSEEQTKEVAPIVEKYEPQLKKIFREGNLAIRGVMDSLDREILPYLTDEQRARLKVRRENRHKGQKGGRRPPGGGRRPPN